MENAVETGHFTLDCSQEPYNLSVNLDEGLQGKGHSKTLLRTFRQFFIDNKFKERYIFRDKGGNVFVINENNFVFIDTDASYNKRGDSFWRCIDIILI